MSINYSVDRSIESTIDRHAERVRRLANLAVTDVQAAAAVRQSLEYLEKAEESKFQELMQNLVVAEIYGKQDQPGNRASQGNPPPKSTQETQLCAEREQQESNNSQETSSSTSMSKTHLILTVGTNALPVWVAWYHLSKKLKRVSTQFVHTSGTKDQKDLLEDYCKNACAFLSESISTSENNPNRNDICEKIIAELPDGCENIHVHYTGGTQAMGVATVCAMLQVAHTLDREVNMDASYLDPGRSRAPHIVSWAYSGPDYLIPDTRVSIEAKMDCDACRCSTDIQITEFNCNACIRKVADLNNFEMAYFRSTHRPKICPHPRKPSKEELCASKTMLEHIQCFDYLNTKKRRRNAFSESLASKWRKRFEEDSCFVYPETKQEFEIPEETHNDTWSEKILPSLRAAYPACQWNCEGTTLSYPARVGADPNQKDDMKKMGSFICGTWLEYAAYAAFKETLEQIDKRHKKVTDNSRSNYELFHHVYIRPKGVSETDKHFELDVVAMLGYQVVVVSCSVTAKSSDVKLKAMEAYHRAKQLGGDEARAVVLCVAEDEVVTDIQKELWDETGTENPLQVWGKCNMEDLCKKVKKLLKELYWD